MTLAVGTKIGRYEIRSQIGEGGMGEVYLAQDTTELERTVAIKVLPAEVAADPKRMQRFVREAKTVSALNHPNILTIHEFGQDMNPERSAVLGQCQQSRDDLARAAATPRTALSYFRAGFALALCGDAAQALTDEMVKR